VKQVTTYVGIDAHKRDLFIAMLMGNDGAPVTWTVLNEPNAVRRLVRKLEREAPGPVHVFYEAGPCGYALQRQVTTSRVTCDVVAPALIPRKPWGAGENESPRCAQAGGIGARGIADGRPAADTRRRGGAGPGASAR
jgi:hypothetical protein